MKKKLLVTFVLFCLGFSSIAQSVYKHCTDGRIYLKLNKACIKQLERENPDNIPLAKLGFIGKNLIKYGVTKARRPFHQAWEDEELPCIIKLEFSKIQLVDDFIRDLTSLPEVVYAEKVSYTTVSAVPNDPLYSGLTHLTQINAPNAWNLYNGTANGSSTITVAIIDNAVMWTHADLVANSYTNTGEIPNNNIDDDGNGYKDDVNGFDVSDLDNNTIPTNLSMNHGTHCAGIAGARTDNNLGISSIGWNVRIIPVKCQTDLGLASIVANGYEGIVYAVKAKARIISCSWGGANTAVTEQSVINYAWSRGSLVIAAAGNNNNSTLWYPAAYNNVYSVAGVTATDTKWSLSNFGTWVDICAPGENINSTVPYVSPSAPAYQPLSGTSMAAPMVAGLAALMLSKSPYMTNTNVMNCISSTAVNIYTVSGNSIYASGNQLGAGRIDAFAAMTCAAGYSSIAPVANFYAFPLFTCPNTTINLYDSSLYAPTSWNWVIQGGSPPTSTLANPIVQWTTPGTYSISLTVANASGTNSVTKLAYVNVGNSQALPFIEGFQTTAFLPAGWSQKNIGNDHIFWERKTGVGGFGTSTACAIFDNFTYFVANERDEMRSPKYDFTNVASAKLNFDVAFARYDATFSDSLEVKLSTNCGSTWTSIYLKGGTTLATAPDQSAVFVPGSTQWRTEITDISNLVSGQGNVMFSFINRGHYGQPIYIDNINIFTPTPTLNITNPGTICLGNSQTFSNTVAATAGYTWSFPGTSAGSSTLANPVVSYTSAGIYTVTLTGFNGTNSATSNATLNVVNIPTTQVAASSGSICSGTSAVLTASGATSYSWNNVAGTHSLQVTPISTGIYTVTGSNGGNCSSSTTILLNVTTTPTLSVSNQTVCAGGTLTLLSMGASSYSWNGSAGSSSYIVSPASTTIYTVNGSNGNCIDTKTLQVTVTPSLNISLNASSFSICTGSSVSIVASGANSYSWSTGAIINSITISPTTVSTLVYTVTGSAGSCSATGIATIHAGSPPSLNLTSSQGTIICSGLTTTLSVTGANTYTWSNALTGNSIIVSPTTTTVYSVTGTNNFCDVTRSITVNAVVNSLTLAVITASASCLTCPDGSADSGINGGTAPYTFTWLPVGGTGSVATGLLPGCYTVNVKDVNQCALSATACIGISLGFNTFGQNESEILIFPNPANNLLTVSYVNTEFGFTMYNAIGQLIVHEANVTNSLDLNVSYFAKGIYFIEIKSDQTFTRKKIIIE